MGNIRGKFTAQRILDVAEQLFADVGYNDTTLRDVVRVAKVNIAAIHYHFGSKDGLLSALVARAMAPVNTERERRVTVLVNRRTRPTVEDVVRAFVEPALRVPRAVGRSVFEAGPRVDQAVADSVRDRYLAALCRAMPELDPPALLSGYAAMVGLLTQHQAGITTQLHNRDDLLTGTPATAEEENLIRFIVAGFEHGLNAATAR